MLIFYYLERIIIKKIEYEVKYRFKGFALYNTSNGKIDILKTIFSLNIFKFLKDLKLDVSGYDKIISDFEPITAWVCRKQNKECYGISNQYALLNKNIPKKRNFIGKFILKWMAPVSYKLGIHFKKYDDSIYLPIINDDILNKECDDFGHYTVYLPSFGLDKVVKELNEHKNIFFHLFHNDANEINIVNNCLIFPINRKSFLKSF